MKCDRKRYNKIIIGNYELNNCIISINDGVIHNIFCRLDMRVIKQEIINKLRVIVESNELDFLINEEKVLTGNEFVLKLLDSDAIKFVKNQKSFFEDLYKKG